MSDTQGYYFNPEGWYVYAVGVQPGSRADVWNLVVQMDEAREEKRSQIFFTPAFPEVEPKIVLDTHTWVGSFWVSPGRRLYAVDGLRLWIVEGGTPVILPLGTPDRMILKVTGLGEDDVFLLGHGGLVLRRTGDTWEDISIPHAASIMDLAGPSPDRLYACGENGGFFQREGGVWAAIDLGTNADIRRLLWSDDASVYGCGANGIAFRYADGETTFFETLPGRDFYGVARFKATIYFGAGGNGVDRLEGGSVVSVKPNVFGQRLAANADYLWSCGGNSIFRFDGNGWLKKSFL